MVRAAAGSMAATHISGAIRAEKDIQRDIQGLIAPARTNSVVVC
jgi:hypothetical protein